MKTKAIQVVSLLSLLSFHAIAADTISLKSSMGDQIVSTLQYGKSIPQSGNLNRHSVSLNSALPAGEIITFSEEGAQQSSRQYYFQVGDAELKNGVEFSTTSLNAVIRISPVAVKGVAPLSKTLLRVFKGNQEYSDTRGLNSLVSSDSLNRNGARFVEGTVAFKMDPSLGFGNFKLQSSDAKGSYILYVYEPNSEWVLNAKTGRSNYLAGDVLSLETQMNRGADAQVFTKLSGFVTSPAGDSIDLSFTSRKGLSNGKLTLPILNTMPRGLWEAHLFTASEVDGVTVYRDLRTAFAVSFATAKLSGDVQLNPAGNLLMGLDIASEGRYQLSGVLYGTDMRGKLGVVARLDSANWFAAGAASMELKLGLYDNRAFNHPYEVRYLQLKDQSRLGVLETRQRALSIPAIKSK